MADPKVKETAGAKFVRLGNKRVPAALKALRLVGNLIGPGYESTPEQRAKVIAALDAEYAKVAGSFKSNKATVDTGGFSI